MVSRNSSAGLTHPTSPPASRVKLHALMVDASDCRHTKKRRGGRREKGEDMKYEDQSDHLYLSWGGEEASSATRGSIL
jgi:hypothetical protein